MTTLSLQSLRIVVLACSWAALPPLQAQPASTESATEPASAPAPEALTDETLRLMLANLGYAPKALSKGFLIAVKREDNWTINMQLVLSPDQTKFGFNANLGKVDEAGVTAAQWAELLVANGDIDPSAFYFDREKQKLYLHRSLDNRAVTPEFLRQQIDKFANNVKSTEKLWAFAK